MKIEITEKKNNPLLSRKEIKGVLTFNTATPSNDDAEAALAKQFNIDKNCVRMKKIATRFGASKADFLAFVYNSEEELKKIEPAPVKWLEKIEKKEVAAKKKAEGAAPKEKPKSEEKKEEKAEEKPAEEKKEAPKKEEKKKGAQ